MSETVEEALLRIRKRGNVDLPVPSCWNTQYSLLPFQTVGALYLIVKPRICLSDVVGSGKTPQALYAWVYVREQLIKENKFLSLWVVATKSSVRQWASEIKKFLKGINVYLPTAEMGKQGRLKLIKKWLDDPNSVLIQNHTSFRLDFVDIKKNFGLDFLKNIQLIIDEAHKVSNPDSQLGQVTREVLASVNRAHFLTATLVRNRVLDAYYTAKALDPNMMSQTLFEKLYCVKQDLWLWRGRRKIKIQKIVSYKNLQEFKEKIAHIYLGRTDDEIQAQRPQVLTLFRSLELPKHQRSIYLKAERGGYLDTENQTAGGAAMIQALQALNAPSILDPTCKENAKVELLKELLEDELKDEPIIIYSFLETVISHFVSAFKDYNPVSITGKKNEIEREEAKRKFQEGETNLIFITDSGGESLNLQRASTVVFISRPWTTSVYFQVIGRARRLGSTHEMVRVYHLSGQDTLDDFVDALLVQKGIDVEEVTNNRGNLLVDIQILPQEIALYARNVRLGRSKSFN